MKKIIYSVLGIVVAVAAIALGTRAFFSDTETSADNTFQTGAIDLTVDAHGYYNNLECKNNVWTPACRPVGSNLVVNGGFENPVVTSGEGWDIFDSADGIGWTVSWIGGTTSLPGYTRPAAALQEYHKGVNGWIPAEGDQYAELDSDWNGHVGSLNNEPALTKISQDISTIAGKNYRLGYWFSARPGTGTNDNKLTVNVDGVQVDYQEKAGAGNTNFTYHEVDFIAADSSSTIEFIGGGSDNSLGVFLDGVSVYEYACSTDDNPFIDTACTSTWEATNLEDQKFFDFGDIKPGDEGENTISLHVDSNNAYACMYTIKGDDLDAPMVEPEDMVDTIKDDLDGTPTGDVDDYTYFFAWMDDGDNVWESGEAPITRDDSGAPTPVLANDFLDRIYPLYTGSEFIPGGTTKYLAISWCAGAMDLTGGVIRCDGEFMGNIAQADTLTADIGFYVEQVRNNPNFSCDVLLEKMPIKTD